MRRSQAGVEAGRAGSNRAGLHVFAFTLSKAHAES